MDFHKGLAVSVEDVKNAHIADEGVQTKYGVKYHQFWVNEEEGTVFCLIEGPDKESCAAVHREAHGNVACSIVEVSAGFYQLFMGEGHRIEQGHVAGKDGLPDVGIRNVLMLDIQGVTTLTKPGDYTSLKIPVKAKQLAVSALSEHHGRELTWLYNDSLVAVFDASVDALQCALHIQSRLTQKTTNRDNDEWNIRFKIGLCAGQPVTENGEFFSEATTLAQRICSFANVNGIMISSKFQEYCNVNQLIENAPGRPDARLLTAGEEKFIDNLYSISEEKLSDENFTVDTLTRIIGMSRPQLYRKMMYLTGKSPNNFLRDLRMDKALSLIKKKAGNISEIALEVGYHNPSYFAKCFQVRYGCTPSRFFV